MALPFSISYLNLLSLLAIEFFPLNIVLVSMLLSLAY
nr:MAG TPA: hypothetical protein [Caudoviricetes sp.]